MAETKNQISPFGRVSFPALFSPRQSDNGGKPRFEVTLLFYPGEMDENQKKLLTAMIEAAKNASMQEFKCLPGANGTRNPFAKTDDKPQWYPAGGVYTRFVSYMKPGLVGPDRRPLEPSDPNSLYAGCWARVSWTIRTYNNSGNKGVGFWLQNLQKVRDDERLGGGYATPDDDFTELAVADSGLDAITF